LDFFVTISPLSSSSPVEEFSVSKKDSKESGEKLLKARKFHETENSSTGEDEDNGEMVTKKSKLVNGDAKKEKKGTLFSNVEKELEKKNQVDTTLAEENKLENFKIHKKTITNLNALGIKFLFPIQAATYEAIYTGKDLIGRDKTGSGKTYSYAIPMIEQFRAAKIFAKKRGQTPFALIVVPTRELAIQVTNTFKTLVHEENEFKVLAVYGGTEVRQQVMDIRAGCDIAVGTPGRVIDMIERGTLKFADLRMVVLDEADQMLDMGFQEDVEKIYDNIFKAKKKEELQNLLFSATIPDWVHNATKKFLKADRTMVDLVTGRENKTPKSVKHYKINCPYQSRMGAIADIITCYGGNHSRTIIFCETKQEANDIMLQAKLKQDCQPLHGDIPQKQREVTFKAFKEGKVQVLIATNVAARGLDIPEVDLIVQLDPPKDVDTYIHRAGRTARAGRSGVCVTFYTKKQTHILERIERFAKIKYEAIGAPQPVDIIKANARDIVISMKNVPQEVLPLFTDIADELTEELGVREALCRALALISGCTEKFKQRSLLCSVEGYITYLAENKIDFRSPSYAWGFLKRHFAFDVTESIKGMRMWANCMGVAFDVPEQYAELFDKFIETQDESNRGFILKKAETLPEFQDDPNGGGYRSTNNYRSYNNADYKPEQSRGNGNSYGGNSYGGNGGGNATGSVLRSKDERKLFVGGLSFDSTDKDLKEFFNKEGFHPEDLVVLKDDNGKSKGIAFVLFPDREGAEKATKLNGKRLGTRNLRINMASAKPK
jgi:ATP-dependent RNA helicase DDX21